MIIGVIGNKFNGKDSVGDILVRCLGYEKNSFANPLKEGCRHIFGFNDEQLYGDEKETEDAYWGITPRQALQFTGTELFRNCMSNLISDVGHDFWIKRLEKELVNNKKIVVCDVRFQNELDMIKKNNGIIIKVERDGIEKNEFSTHDSENIDNLKYDHLIKNNGTLEELEQKVLDLFK